MFTGLIEEVGAVTAVRESGDGRLITIRASVVLDGTGTGDSISVNGACQTVTALSGDGFTVFASHVTCRLTTLGEFIPGRQVNLERALTPSSRMGGHIVQGHVDGSGIIRSMRADANGLDVTVSAGDDLARYIVERGSIAVDGVSLTVVRCERGSFSLYLIPETLKNTIIPRWKAGDRVNIETDILAKYVEKMLSREKSPDDELMRVLREEGFAG